MTEKLYYSDPYLQTFSAVVRSCEPVKSGFAVTLDRTAFYPEGGGQPCDIGTLGDAQVTDVHEKDGEILHTCSKPLPVGEQVQGSLDWTRRFDNMQNHSGEHIVSGLIHQKYGYDNVGFHMGSDFITIDFNGIIDEAGLREIERKANEKVAENFPVEITWPTAEELESLPYRSKKQLTGAVRIVTFPEVDCCACCGTHVVRTGEIGMIKLFSCVKFHSGVRIEMLCGRRCLDYVNQLCDENHHVSVLLSAKPHETSKAVERLLQSSEQLKARTAALEAESFALISQSYAGQGSVTVFRPAMEPDSLRRLCEAITASCGGSCFLFAGSEGEGWKYCLSTPEGDPRPLCKALNEAFQGRGGGRGTIVQGSLNASRTRLEDFLKNY